MYVVCVAPSNIYVLAGAEFRSFLSVVRDDDEEGWMVSRGWFVIIVIAAGVNEREKIGEKDHEDAEREDKKRQPILRCIFCRNVII